jgi:hypothetical protein
MPIDLTKPAASSSLSSAVIRAQFAEVAAELDLKANADNPNITGSLTLTDGGGLVSGIPGIGGFVFLGGNGATFDKKPIVTWYNYAAGANQGQWYAWADVASWHLSAVTDDGVTSFTDAILITRSGLTPSVFLPNGLTVGSTTLLSTNVALSNAAAAATATMTNAPTAGNPTKWISINDNGTVRRIPAW